MVKVAVAGGTGNVATNLLKTAVNSGEHDITIFTRSVPKDPLPNITYKQVDYTDRTALTSLLRGTDVCLSFFVVHFDTDNIGQKNLIHACIDAGVKRFAPSEWGIKSDSGIAAYANKDAIAKYLKELETKGELKGMEYCLFQPSIFMDYFAHPFPLAKELITWPFFVDFENRRAMLLDEGDQPIVITCVHDDAEILHRALSDSRPWPTIGGVRGCRTTNGELIALGKKIRGGNWNVERIRSEDILNNKLKTSWVPRMAHPAIPVEQQEKYSGQFVCDFLTQIVKGTWMVSDEWNQRFPEYKFQSAEEYLTAAWEGKP